VVDIAFNLAAVRERMAQAAGRARRRPEDIALMAVTKTVEPARIREAHAAGLRLFGENRVQEFAGKAAEVGGLAGAAWHMIGHLQSNKAAKAAELFAGVDSVDSLHLAEKLDSAAEKLGRPLPVLLEINVGGEAAKSGLAPHSTELEAILAAAPRLAHLEIRGLMCIPPFTEDPQGARPYFRQLGALLAELAARKLPAATLDVLSMGMSHDFEVAIEEGSTCVRVGTAIFGERPKK
jgi:pyridoxal phosphate enzyme (YggS family)